MIARAMPNPATIEVMVAAQATEDLVAAFRRLIPQLSSSAIPPDLEALADIIAAPSNTVLVAHDRNNGDNIVGVLTLVMFRIPTAVRAWIEDVVVDSTARGRGVGEVLTQRALLIAAQRGAKTIDLTSNRSREAAHRLYEKAGFKLRDSNLYRYVLPAVTNED
jgi:ribosomal protein S18 acetylase RimI-like enzyme